MPSIYERARCRRRGFSMVELLVVIAVLGLLISLVAVVGSRAIQQQKVRNTQQTIQNTMLAIEQFATEDPLHAVYGKKGRETFGKYPAYQLANATVSNSVGDVLESSHSVLGHVPNNLQERLASDLSGESNPDNNDWALIRHPDDVPTDDGNGDIEALYAYLTAYSPASLDLIPEGARKPFYSKADVDHRSFVNPKGSPGGDPGDPGGQDWRDVLAIHDAWGVPMDYMLYIKCEYKLRPGTNNAAWIVTERRPVLRSLGIKREVYDAMMQVAPGDRFFDPAKWVFSEELPKPWFGGASGTINANGTFGFSNATANGWVRAVGEEESYAYRPDADKGIADE